MTPAPRWLLPAVQLLLAVMVTFVIWVQLMRRLFAGPFQSLAVLSGPMPEMSAILLGALLVLALLVKSGTGISPWSRWSWAIWAAILHAILWGAAIPVIFFWFESRPTSGGGDVANLRGVVEVVVGFIIAPVLVIPLTSTVIGASAAFFAWRRRKSALEAAADASTALLVPLIAGVLFASTTSFYRPPRPSMPAGVTRAPLVPFGRILTVAASRGDVAKVKEALATGAPADGDDPSGYTALITAVLARPPLHHERPDFEKEQLEIVEMLLAAGADVNAKDPTGKTALDHAEARGLTQIAERLRAARSRAATSGE